jgi:hypothetical protein
MKKYTLAIIAFALLLYSCKKKCEGGCGANYTCTNGQCQCQEWYEGSNCDTPMSQKFNGIFIGMLYTNGTNPKTDTQSLTNLDNGKILPNQANFQNYNPNGFGSQPSGVNLARILLTSSTEGNCYVWSTPIANLDASYNCGPCQITKDGKTLTFSYYPLTLYSNIPDSTTMYTFVGTKQ